MGFISTFMELEVGALLLGSCFRSHYKQPLLHAFFIKLFIYIEPSLHSKYFSHGHSSALSYEHSCTWGWQTLPCGRTKNNEQKPFVRVTTESSGYFINNQPKGLYRSQCFAIALPTALTPTHKASPLLPASLQTSPPPPRSVPKGSTSIPYLCFNHQPMGFHRLQE